MSRSLVRSLLVLVFSLSGGAALAHDSWISRGGLKNSAGEWCCGDYDCKSYTKTSSTSVGWMVDGELVPFDEAMPVPPPAGHVRSGRRPEGPRRCFFGLKPGL